MKRGDPLREAVRIQRGAVRTGFDWDNPDDLWAKLQEEIEELKAVRGHRVRATDELGDLLFMVVNLARHLKVDPLRALTGANRKFRFRYGHIMKHARALPPKGSRQRLAAMERYWQEAKRLEKARNPK